MTTPRPAALADNQLRITFTPDVEQTRRNAMKIAGQMLRAASFAITNETNTITLHIPADPETANLQAASLLSLAQRLDPISAGTTKRERTTAIKIAKTRQNNNQQSTTGTEP